MEAEPLGDAQLTPLTKFSGCRPSLNSSSSSDDALTRQERRLIASQLCRLVRERGYLEEVIGPLAEPDP